MKVFRSLSGYLHKSSVYLRRTNLCNFSQNKLKIQDLSRSNYSNQVVNKYILSRTPNERCSVYLDSNLTVGEFMAKLQELFPNCKMGVSTKTQMINVLGYTVNLDEENKQFQKIKNDPLIYALLLNKFFVYEKNAKNVTVIIFGIQISQFNLTNRLNIPEYVEQGIAELNNELMQLPIMSIQKALSFSNIRKYSQGSLEFQKGQIIETGLSQEQVQALKQSIKQLVFIRKFDQKIGPYLPTTNKLMKTMVAILTVNWIMLFYITYGLYGWDVGEPVSYLTGLGVDLIAMMGFFEINQALTTRRQQDKQAIERVLNMRANQHMAKWRIAYLMRKIKI